MIDCSDHAKVKPYFNQQIVSAHSEYESDNTATNGQYATNSYHPTVN